MVVVLTSLAEVIVVADYSGLFQPPDGSKKYDVCRFACAKCARTDKTPTSAGLVLAQLTQLAQPRGVQQHFQRVKETSILLPPL